MVKNMSINVKIVMILFVAQNVLIAMKNMNVIVSIMNVMKVLIFVVNAKIFVLHVVYAGNILFLFALLDFCQE